MEDLEEIHVGFTGSNSILCVEWVHEKCSGTSGKLKNNMDFHCQRCLEGSPDHQSILLRDVEIEPNVKLKCVSRFWYLGDMLCVGGGIVHRLSSRSYLPS